MKKIIKISIYIFSSIVLLFLIGLLYLNFGLPRIPKTPNIKVSYDSATIKRGEYLANNVLACMDCHSKRDWNYFSGPLIEGSFGGGGEVFDEESSGLPGKLYSKNITPFALKDWTDEEIYLAITTGITKDNNVIFPIMPWMSYSKMDLKDIEAVIAYLRSLPNNSNIVPQSKLNFPMNLIVRTFPKEPSHLTKPQESDSINYGKYLVEVAACSDCHTPVENHQKINNMEFAGGFEFKMGDYGKVKSANITPDVETGIGQWSEEQFISRFKAYSKPEALKIKVEKGKFQTVMPWTMYSGMKEEDLKAIYKFLRSLKPINNQVIRYSRN